jgi:hypothetical protein
MVIQLLLLTCSSFLLWFYVIVLMRFMFCTLCSHVFPELPVPTSAINLPCMLVTVDVTLLGMVSIELLLLLPSPALSALMHGWVW